MKSLILAAAILCLSPHAATAQDAAAGEAVFKKCTACHAVGEGARNRMGPVLNGVYGRTAGTLEGYSYSRAMVEAGAGGLVWTPETIAAFLHNPREYVPGTKMSFVGIPDEEEIANLQAYLMTFSPDYVPEEAAAAQ